METSRSAGASVLPRGGYNTRPATLLILPTTPVVLMRMDLFLPVEPILPPGGCRLARVEKIELMNRPARLLRRSHNTGTTPIATFVP
jgi:hypothetical protein